MATKRLKAAWRVLTARNAIIIATHKDSVTQMAVSKGLTLDQMILTGVALKRVYNDHVDDINDQAADAGDLHAAEALRNTVDKLEKL